MKAGERRSAGTAGRSLRAGAREEERGGGRWQGGRSRPVPPIQISGVGGGGREEGPSGEMPRVSRKASWQPRFNKQCWARFFGVGVPNKPVGNQSVWRDYFTFFAHNLSISDSKQNLNCRSF